MQVGTLVKYNERGLLLRLFGQHPHGLGQQITDPVSLIGIVVSTQERGARVRWNNGTTLWDNVLFLEVLCK